MGDYVVRLTGQDNLSSTVKQVKKELNDVGSVGKTALEKIDAKFNRIIQSSAPLKRQLKDLQAIMAEMNFKNLNTTDEFSKIAQEAGRIKDAISDAAAATKHFASDTEKLDSAIQTFQAFAAVGSVATGVVALFGAENQDAAKAIQKVQGALAILNGVQALANTFQKESALMLKLKQIQIAANTKSTASNTVATAANTTATAANTVGTVANTAAQKAWNTAKAIGKAMLGDWTGLLILGVAGLTAYSIATQKSADSQEEMNAATKKGAEIQSTYGRTLSDTYASLMTKYTQLRAEWNKLSNDHQRTKWIEQNKSKLNELEASINNVGDAEKYFNGNTDAVCQAFIKRAQAAARLAQLTELYRKQMELIDKRNQTATAIQLDAERSGRSARAGDVITDETFRTSRYGSVNKAGQWVFSEQGAKLYSGSDTSSNSVIRTIDAEIDSVNGQIGKVVDAIKNESSIPILGGGGTTTTNKGGGKGTDKPTYLPNSLSDLEHRLSELQQRLKDGLIPSDKVEETKVRIEELKDEILKKKIQLGLEIDPILKNNQALKEKILSEVNKWFENKGSEQLTPQLSSFDKAVGNNPYDTSNIEGIENMMNYNDTLIDKLSETREKLEGLKNALEEAGLTGSEAFNNVANELEKVNGTIVKVQDEQVQLSEKASQANEKQKQQEQRIKTFNEIADAANNAANMISNMANASDDKTFQTAAIIAEAIANVISGYASASAQASSLGPWGWAAFSLAGLAQVAAMVSQIHSLSGFANGGIVGGGSYSGDKILARLNSSEMVLNPRQQSNLFKAIDSGAITFGGGDDVIPEINFRIKGSDLYGSMKNFSKTAAKSGRITGIK